MTDTAEFHVPDFVHEATAEKLLAEARKFSAEAAEAEHKAAKAKIDLEREEHKRRKELAADEFHHTYLFASQVDSTTVKACIDRLSYWERTAEGAQLTVELQINSPGGGIFEGFALFDHIMGMQHRGHVVNTTAYGMAASMGGVLLQAGNTRRMGQNAALLIHEASFRAGGKTGDVEDEMILVQMLQDGILDIYATRASGSAAEHPMSRVKIKNQWRRRDWWTNSTNSLKHGFVDDVV